MESEKEEKVVVFHHTIKKETTEIIAPTTTTTTTTRTSTTTITTTITASTTTTTTTTTITGSTNVINPLLEETINTDDWVLIDFNENDVINNNKSLGSDLENESFEWCPLENDPLNNDPSKSDPPKCDTLEDNLLFLEDHIEGQQNSSLDPALTLESLVLEDDPDLPLSPCDGGEEEEEVVEEEEEEVEEEEGEVALFHSDFRVGGSHRRKEVTLEERLRDRTRETKKKKYQPTKASDKARNHPSPNTHAHHPFCRRPQVITPPDKHPRKNRRKRKEVVCTYCDYIRSKVIISKESGRTVYHQLDRKKLDKWEGFGMQEVVMDGTRERR